MKKDLHAILLAFCMLLWISPAHGQYSRGIKVASGNEWPFPLELNGTMMAYDFGDTDSLVPWSDDMEPIFINYIARHGARYLSSEKKIDKLRKDLRKAQREGNLSSAGEDFLKVINMVDSATGGNWGALNFVGMQEEQLLGKQMYGIAPNVLKRGRVKACATYVPRVVMTMYELCHELARLTPDIEVTASEGKQFNTLLRYFKTDSTYVRYIDDGPWIEEYNKFSQSVTPCSPAAKLFITPPDDDKLRKQTMDMYGVLQSLTASNLYAPADKWFTKQEYDACWRVDNLRHYYQRSVSEFSDFPARAAIPLLKDIISATDHALNGDTTLNASMCFGHAETVIPLFALMRLPGCYAPDCKPADVAAQWKDYGISPLGANLLMVVLKDSGGKAYVAMRLNGKWIDFNGKKVIPWNILKAQWISFISN